MAIIIATIAISWIN